MLYFDTSFLVPLFLDEPTSEQIERFVKRQQKSELLTSQWTRVEFSSLVARDVRMGDLDQETALGVDTEFEAVVTETFVIALPVAEDFDLARQLLRRHETRLRSGDALHLAIASNRGARAIYSLDKGLLAAGKLLGLPVKGGPQLP